MDYNESFNIYREIEDIINSIHTTDFKKKLNRIDRCINKLLIDHGMNTYFEIGFDEVHKSNMSKLEEGKALYRKDGKVLKGKDYFKPNLRDLIHG